MSENDASSGPQLEPWFSETPKPRRRPEAETVPIEALSGVDLSSDTSPMTTAPTEQLSVEQQEQPWFERDIDAQPEASGTEGEATAAAAPAEPGERPNARRRRLRRTSLAVLGGARPDAIEGAPGDRQAYSSMALILMFTATVAALSMAFALGMVFHADWFWFIPVGIFWGAGIFAIDRALTIQLSNTKGAWKTTFAVVPRVLLAAILGTVISTPVTLQIFAPEISAQILVMEAEARTSFANQLASDPILSTEDTVRASIASNQAIIDKSDAVDPLTDPTYAAAKAAEDAALADLNAKTAAWQAEANGTGGSGQVGDGAVTQIARQAVDSAQTVYDQAQKATAAALATAQPALTSQLKDSKTTAEAALAKAQADLATIEQRKSDFQAQNDAAVSSSDGISNRLTALDRLSKESPSAGLAHVMVFLLFFAIELLPVIIKLLRNLGNKESVHDETAREHDRTEIARVRQQFALERDQALLDAQITTGRLATLRQLAEHEEELALATGKERNLGLDDRVRSKSQDFFDEWDREQSEQRRR
ncbi:DUF4407 domain-containing protein [Agreia sp. Leaf335]|uniref:DUF4407 domain-containing protein n=1 Tax=Agreia sp. Leaf335 TaxID=1736340 RepID=UPI000A91198B|nr:DUF4407 domain-containing protein [Agreia sp. Leaf335]